MRDQKHYLQRTRNSSNKSILYYYRKLHKWCINNNTYNYIKKSETVSISVTDGTIPGAASTVIPVNPAVLNNFLVQNTSGANIGSQIAGTSFNIKISARDIENNICSAGTNVFTGTVDISLQEHYLQEAEQVLHLLQVYLHRKQ